MSEMLIGGIKFETDEIFKNSSTTKRQEIYKKYMEILENLEKDARAKKMKEFYFKPAVFQYDENEKERLFDTDDGRKITLTGPDSSKAISDIKQAIKDNPEKFTFTISKTSSNKGYTITLKDEPEKVEPKKDAKKTTAKKETVKK